MLSKLQIPRQDTDSKPKRQRGLSARGQPRKNLSCSCTCTCFQQQYGNENSSLFLNSPSSFYECRYEVIPSEIKADHKTQSNKSEVEEQPTSSDMSTQPDNAQIIPISSPSNVQEPPLNGTSILYTIEVKIVGEIHYCWYSQVHNYTLVKKSFYEQLLCKDPRMANSKFTLPSPWPGQKGFDVASFNLYYEIPKMDHMERVIKAVILERLPQNIIFGMDIMVKSVHLSNPEEIYFSHRWYEQDIFISPAYSATIGPLLNFAQREEIRRVQLAAIESHENCF